jgi:dTDP-4-dehydrorhamnose 3,5-epimerase
MTFHETKLKGAFIIDLDKIEDERGFFARSWCKREFDDRHIDLDVVQTNISYNRKKGTLRGMHYQRHPYAEAKTVRCTAGAIYDVIVDIRPESVTFMQWVGIELTKESFKMIYMPPGFAHGYLTLANHTSVHYMVNQFFVPGAQEGIPYNDPAFNIQWPIKPTIISLNDRNHVPFFSHAQHGIAAAR